MLKIKNKKKCCGCKACGQICPRQCISFKTDKEGFWYPNVDERKCVDCHLCEKVCPFCHEGTQQLPAKVYGAYNLDNEERGNSSSGGIFILMAKEILKQGGVVFGAIFDESWNVKHVYAEKIENVYPMLQSKYVQSDIGNTFKETKDFLLQGRKVLYCGTPCQILGLKNFLRKNYDNLIAVDFLCHGVPSPGVWRKYIEREIATFARSAMTGKNSVLNSSLNFKSPIGDIQFRDKTYRGWKKYSFVVRKKSPSKGDQNTVLLSDSHYTNPYMKGFLSDIFLRPSCYDCKCKNGRSGSDLTLGDFWCADHVDNAMDDDKGLSLLQVYNSSIMEGLEKKCWLKEFSYKDVRNLNGGFIEQHFCNKAQRVLFFHFYRYMDMKNSLKYSIPLGKIINKLLWLWR